MVTTSIDRETPKIGSGIYTASDAAKILNIPYGKANYWFNHYVKTKLPEQVGFQYQFTINKITAVNFLSLIEMYVFYCLREKRITTSKIIDAHSNMSKLLATPYPFAKQDLFTDGKHLLFELGDIHITADSKLQIEIWECLHSYFEKISFSSNRLATKFFPLGTNKTIVVNPENQFGQPIIEGTNILAQTISCLYNGGESIESIQRLFDISKENVVDAIDFCKAA
jgi:uncharacterized protein (DUF433 family)